MFNSIDSTGTQGVYSDRVGIIKQLHRIKFLKIQLYLIVLVLPCL